MGRCKNEHESKIIFTFFFSFILSKSEFNYTLKNQALFSETVAKMKKIYGEGLRVIISSFISPCCFHLCSINTRDLVPYQIQSFLALDLSIVVIFHFLTLQKIYVFCFRKRIKLTHVIYHARICSLQLFP